VQLAELDANSPEVLAAIRDHSHDPIAFKAALFDLRGKKQAAQQAPANPAQIMSGGGGQHVPPVTTDSLQAEYINLTKDLPPGEQGVRRRLDAKIAIRMKAAQAQVNSPV
jgi:hypothetical protein